MPIHEFLDVTKAACPDLRHRMILHNHDLGPELAMRAFPGRSDVRSLALRHVGEDLGRLPSVASWLACCDLARLPRLPSRRRGFDPDELIGAIVRQHRLASTVEARAVLDLLMLPARLAPDAGDAAYAILCNAIGPTISRLVLGPPREVAGSDGRPAIFDPGWIAEAIIWWLMGGWIPTLSDVTISLSHNANPSATA